jgi:iron complex transport system substrate-binding protein
MRKLLTIALIAFGVLTNTHAAFADTPLRVVSLKPSITDTVYALGLGEKLVGVTRYCDIPTGHKKPAIVGDYTKPYTERIVGLAPDIVLGSQENSSRRSIENLERMGISVKLFPFEKLDQAIDSCKGIGELLGAPERGRQLAHKMQRELSELKEKYSNVKPTRLLIVWGTRPIVVAGTGTFMDDAIAAIRCKNALTKTSVRYPKIGLEEIVAISPDVILDLSMGSEAHDPAPKPWERTEAVKARVIRMSADDFRAGPHLIEGLKKLAIEIQKRNTTGDS